MLVARRRGAHLVHQVECLETIEAEGMENFRYFPPRNGFRHSFAGNWGRLEAIRSPASVQLVISDRAFAHDRTVVRGHIGDAGPLAQQSHIGQKGE